MIVRNKSLRAHNTLALQARADAFASITSDDELLAALAWARKTGMSVVPLGECSNIVLASDLNALVLQQQTKGIRVLERDLTRVRLRVAAGEQWHHLVHWCLLQGYSGLENLALIPGTVGAAPIQNIGAYGVELQSVVSHVHARQLADDRVITLSNADCEFAYRDSIFKRTLQDQLFITAVDIELSLQPRLEISYPALAAYLEQHTIASPAPIDVFNAVVAIRSSKLPDPAVEPNAGSFFKNPLVAAAKAEKLLLQYASLPNFLQPDGTVKLSAAWMIDNCGWRGYRAGNLGVHAQHALVLVNYGSDSGTALLALAREIADSVFNAFGVALEIEPRLYGAP